MASDPVPEVLKSSTETDLVPCLVRPTVPAPVRSLVLTGCGTEELRVAWSAAPGDVDHYEVQLLFSDMKVFPSITLGSGVEECVLSSLTPGRLYKILVSTFSGPNQRAQFIEGRTGQQTPVTATSPRTNPERSRACSSTVPSQVKNIHVSNGGDSTSLRVSWTPGQGDVDAFLVFLFRQTRQLNVRRVLKHQNEVSFGSLQPGQMYGVTVQSVSGELLSNNTASGRTGEYRPGHRHVRASVAPHRLTSVVCFYLYFLPPVPSAVTGLQVEDLHSTHSLQVSWKEALGVADGYVLQLLDDRGGLVTNCSLAFGETRHRFEALTAGRKYRVQVQTASGGVHSQRVSTEARTCD